MQVAGVGRVIFWSGGSLWIGTALAPVDLHAHHAIQVAFGLSGPVQFTPGDGAGWSAYPAAVISSGLLHAFKAPGRLVAQLFCEPESSVGRQLSQRFGGAGISGVPAGEATSIATTLQDAFEAGAPDEDLEQLALDALFSLAGSAPTRSTDRRIARAIAFMQERLADAISLEEAASAVDLSPGRFRHLFVAETGIAFRAHLLWARLNRALSLGFAGMPWTEAAQAANFADSAHLSRTCRRMYGLAPTAIRRDAPELIRQLTA